MKLSSATPEQLDAIEAALDPFLKWVEVNDGDTLSQCRMDEEIITVASGSWRPATHVTVGDFRKLSSSVRVVIDSDKEVRTYRYWIPPAP